MRIGVPTEVKNHEYRVGLVPAAAHALVEDGHDVIIQQQAGAGSGFADAEYEEAGARIVPDADAVWSEAEMIIKVKEPIAEEYPRMRRGQMLFTYLHLAPLPELTDTLLERGITGVAYETIVDQHGHLPLLTPMSEVAGRMAVLVGTYYQQRPLGGRGTLLCGVPGVPPGDLMIIGGGIVGLNAAKIAHGFGGRVTVLDTNLERLRFIDDLFHGGVTTLASNAHNVRSALRRADVVVGAVLLPGRSAPKLVGRADLELMKRGSVIVDVAVDQGGCFETTRPTTHSDPVFEVDGIVHYCVANMPGAVPRTSTLALNNATLPYARALAGKGLERAVADDAGLGAGVNTYAGQITCRAVAESQGKAYVPLAEALGTAAAG